VHTLEQASLRGMRALQTLVLYCEHLEAVVPFLDVAAMPDLAYLILDHVYPQRLALPPQCSLDLRCPAFGFNFSCCKPSCQLQR
jgi:hypothetical protein